MLALPTLVNLRGVREAGLVFLVRVPELMRRRWYHFFLESHTTILKALVLLEGGPQIVVIDCPWYLQDALDDNRGAEG